MVRRLDAIVSVEPEGVIARGAGQRRVAGGGEVINPDEVEHARPERACDLDRAVGRAGVDDHDLIEEAARRFQAGGKVGLLVAYDHGEADPAGPRRLRRHVGRRVRFHRLAGATVVLMDEQIVRHPEAEAGALDPEREAIGP